MRGEPNFTADALRVEFSYDSMTGVFHWKTKRRGRLRGMVAGCIHPSDGYRQIRLWNHIYPAHRLAWLYHYGEWPCDQLDHINGVKDDNRIANLRIATYQQNQANSKRRIGNRAGLKGVIFLSEGRRQKRYRAKIKANGKHIFLGIFHTAEEAHAAYCAAASKYFGEFARVA